jgi:AcrR family transcriptional regulator
VRRASYGPNSPVVGERGARTRRAIIDAALASFEAKGFHATSVDDIADAIGISRATLYQYFESKEQLFIELMHETGADLLRLIRRLGSLGPTAEGYDNLHWWLGEWAWVQDKYRPLYLQWAVVDSPQAPLRPLMAEFIESYVSRLSPRFASAVGDDRDIDPDGVALVLLALVLRVNDYRQKGINRTLNDDELLDGLATFVQLALFPSTPASALAAHAPPGRAVQPPRAAAAPRRPDGHRRVLGQIQPDPARFGSGRPRVLQTVQRLLDAGAATFGVRGFHATSVEDVLKASGLGRGTFYKYFEDRTDLLVTLAQDCAVRLEEMAERFAGVVGADDEPAALRRWLTEYLAFHRRYRGAFRALIEQDPQHPVLDELGVRTGEAVLLTFDDALARIERDYPFDVRVGSLVLLALLERGPDYAFGTTYDLSDERVVEVLAGLIERGLLGRRAARIHDAGAGLSASTSTTSTTGPGA